MFQQRALLIFVILLAGLWIASQVAENFGGTSPGTLLQLASSSTSGDYGYGYGYYGNNDWGYLGSGYNYYGYPRGTLYNRAPREGYYRYGYPTGRYGNYGYGLYPTYAGYRYGDLNWGYPYYGGY